MKPSDKKKYLFDNPFYRTLLIRGLYIICILLIVLDFILHRHITHRWEELTGFYAIFGFVAYVTIVLAAGQLRKIVRRKEDYYDVDD
jgi:hypothetical protein